MKSNPSIQLRRQGPSADVKCRCGAVVATLAPGERLAMPGAAGAVARSGRCACGQGWRVTVVSEASHGQ